MNHLRVENLSDQHISWQNLFEWIVTVCFRKISFFDNWKKKNVVRALWSLRFRTSEIFTLCEFEHVYMCLPLIVELKESTNLCLLMNFWIESAQMIYGSGTFCSVNLHFSETRFLFNTQFLVFLSLCARVFNSNYIIASSSGFLK